MIKITRGNTVLGNKFFLFSGGECHIKLESDHFKFKFASGPINIIARIQDANSFIELALAKDALERMFPKVDINLYSFWMPFGQQDKIFVPGEPLSVKVFANLINSLSFSRIFIADPHSEIPAAIFDNIEIISQLKIIENFPEFTKRVMRGATFVSPDAGGNKKTAALCSYFGHSEFIRADKRRNLATGEILETVVFADDLQGRDIIIADDIAKGSATFIELAKVLKKKGAANIVLYCTHGIFSKGTRIVYDGGISEIFTTNSFYETLQEGIDIPSQNILDLEKTFIK